MSFQKRKKEDKVICFFSLCFISSILAILLCTSSANAEVFVNTNDYHITIRLEPSTEILDKIMSEAQNTLERRIATETHITGDISYRFEQDRLYLLKILQAQGYHQAEIEATFKEDTRTADFKIYPHQQYKFGKIKLFVNGKETNVSNEISLPSLNFLKAQTNTPALVAEVIEDEQVIREWIEQHNCFFKYSVKHTAVINNLEKQVDITYFIIAHDQAVFGDIVFSGQETIAELYLNRSIVLRKGNCFKRSQIDETKILLMKTGLLVEVDVIIPSTLLPDKSVPINFKLKERTHRSIKTGAHYSTDIGFGFGAKWEHNNFLSHGEKLATTLSLAKVESRLDTKFIKPFFLRKDQRLKISGSLRREDNEAYKARGLNISGNVERDIGNKKTVGIGAKYGFEKVEKEYVTKNLMLFSVPVFASQDKRDNILNPRSGWTVNVSTEPLINTIDVGTAFLKNRLSGSFYQPISTIGQSIVAVRVAIGSILGITKNAVPATEKFYVGGGGSVRGYEYQLVGPVDTKNNPLGGRSFIDLSTELRIRINQDYGFVTFLDGGNAYEAAFPNFKTKMRWGAGIGLRYYTKFGPLRVDIGLPLNKRKGLDKAYQFYFSIGQAF